MKRGVQQKKEVLTEGHASVTFSLKEKGGRRSWQVRKKGFSQNPRRTKGGGEVP